MCGSLEKRGDGDRQRDRDRPGFKGPFGLLRSRRIKNDDNAVGWPLVLKCPESPEMSWKMKKMEMS